MMTISSSEVVTGELPFVHEHSSVLIRFSSSLQATWIRNSLIHVLRSSSKADIRSIPSTFVYQNPTIQSLSEAVFDLATVSTCSTPPETAESKVAAMHALAAKYAEDFPLHNPREGHILPTQDTVVLTGSTGGLGVSLLVKLVQSPEVTKIYALNRKNGSTLLSRQQEALSRRGYDAAIACSPKVVLLETDLSESELGLSKETYQEVNYDVCPFLVVGTDFT